MLHVFVLLMAEQLVEAPSLVSLVRIFEQTVDIPGRAGGRGVTGGLKGSLFAAEQIVDTPVPHCGSSGSLHGIHPGQSSTALAAQIVDTPVPHGGRQNPDLPSAASSSGLPDTANQGVFRSFHRREKSARMGPHSGSELGADFSSSTPASHVSGFFTDAAGRVWMQFPDGRVVAWVICSLVPTWVV